MVSVTYWVIFTCKLKTIHNVIFKIFIILTYYYYPTQFEMVREQGTSEHWVLFLRSSHVKKYSLTRALTEHNYEKGNNKDNVNLF